MYSVDFHFTNVKDWKITCIIASCAILAILFKNYFKGTKYGGVLLKCTKLPLIVLCWKSWQLTLWVDFKIESVLQAKRKKKVIYTYLVNEEMGAVAVTVDSQ